MSLQTLVLKNYFVREVGCFHRAGHNLLVTHYFDLSDNPAANKTNVSIEIYEFFLFSSRVN